jgi:hypothetical protein
VTNHKLNGIWLLEFNVVLYVKPAFYYMIGNGVRADAVMIDFYYTQQRKQPRIFTSIGAKSPAHF